MIIPKHLFADYIGAKSREAPTNLKPVGTGPYKFKDFKPGDLVAGVINPNYHMENRPHFDAIEMKGGGDAVSAARAVLQTGEFDFAWNMQVEDEILSAWRRAARAASSSAGRRHRAHPAQQHRPLDRGRRRALQPQDQASDPVAIRRCARRWPCWSTRTRSRSTSTAAPAWRRRTSSTTRSASLPRRRSTSSTSTRRTTSSTRPAGRRAPTASGQKDGKKLKFVYQTSINQPRQKTQAIIKQACPEGRHRHRAEVGDGVGVLLVRRRQSGHLRASSTATCRCTTTAWRSPTLRYSCASSVRGRRRPRTTSGRAATSRAGRTRNTTTSTRPAQVELDPVKRAAMMIKLNELVVNNHVVIPLVARLGVAAVNNRLVGRAQRLGQQHLAIWRTGTGKADFPVIPSGAARRAAQSRDLFLSMQQQNRSLHCASLRSAPVGMTGSPAVDGGSRACSHPLCTHLAG